MACGCASWRPSSTATGGGQLGGDGRRPPPGRHGPDRGHRRLPATAPCLVVLTTANTCWTRSARARPVLLGWRASRCSPPAERSSAWTTSRSGRCRRWTEAAAVELFVDRAVTATPSFPRGRHREAIREISRRVDGIPLALELAAGRTRPLPRAIADGSTTASGCCGVADAERHQTLRDTVQWSYDLLIPAEAAFPPPLLFAGGFTVEAAERCAPTSAVDSRRRRPPRRVVDKSMVQRDARQGPFLLLETLRQFGEEQLHATGEAAAADRHSRFSGAWQDLDRGTSPRRSEAWARFDAEWDNLPGRLDACDTATSKCGRHGTGLLLLRVHGHAPRSRRLGSQLLADESGLSTITAARLRGARSGRLEHRRPSLRGGAVRRRRGRRDAGRHLLLHHRPLRLPPARRPASPRREWRWRFLSRPGPTTPENLTWPPMLSRRTWQPPATATPAVDWANQAMAIASEAGSSSAVAHAVHRQKHCLRRQPYGHREHHGLPLGVEAPRSTQPRSPPPSRVASSSEVSAARRASPRRRGSCSIRRPPCAWRRPARPRSPATARDPDVAQLDRS